MQGHKVRRGNDGLQPTKVIATMANLFPPDLVPLRDFRSLLQVRLEEPEPFVEVA